ncbi:MAG: HYR domain-containing protein [Bacteroidales bacterium]
MTVVDTQNPTITCPADVLNVPADAGQCYASRREPLARPTTADNCGVATVTNNAPVQFPVGSTTVTRTVTDVHGNTATCNQTVTVIDTQNPTITCPADVTHRTCRCRQCYATGVPLVV